MPSADRQRRAYEKKLRDPDDCYLEVAAREEARREQGLASRIRILHGVTEAAHEEIVDISIEEREEQDNGAIKPDGLEKRISCSRY